MPYLQMFNIEYEGMEKYILQKMMIRLLVTNIGFVCIKVPSVQGILVFVT